MRNVVERTHSESDEPAAADPERPHGDPYERTTPMGSHGQEGWHGGYDLPVPGQSGQQQDYLHQQTYPGAHTERELPTDDEPEGDEQAV